jgi:hypothetical protein
MSNNAKLQELAAQLFNNENQMQVQIDIFFNDFSFIRNNNKVVIQSPLDLYLFLKNLSDLVTDSNTLFFSDNYYDEMLRSFPSLVPPKTVWKTLKYPCVKPTEIPPFRPINKLQSPDLPPSNVYRGRTLTPAPLPPSGQPPRYPFDLRTSTAGGRKIKTNRRDRSRRYSRRRDTRLSRRNRLVV